MPSYGIWFPNNLGILYFVGEEFDIPEPYPESILKQAWYIFAGISLNHKVCLGVYFKKEDAYSNCRIFNDNITQEVDPNRFPVRLALIQEKLVELVKYEEL